MTHENKVESSMAEILTEISSAEQKLKTIMTQKLTTDGAQHQSQAAKLQAIWQQEKSQTGVFKILI